MIKVYGMPTCPDCQAISQFLKDNKDKYEYIDISASPLNLKEFLNLRDKYEIFNKCKERGTIGIPCFLLEDNSVVIGAKRMGILVSEGSKSCSLEDHKNGKEGC